MLRYNFYMNTNMQGDFQICISVPLNTPKTWNRNIAYNIFLVFTLETPGIPGHTPNLHYPHDTKTQHVFVTGLLQNLYGAKSKITKHNHISDIINSRSRLPTILQPQQRSSTPTIKQKWLKVLLAQLKICPKWLLHSVISIHGPLHVH